MTWLAWITLTTAMAAAFVVADRAVDRFTRDGKRRQERANGTTRKAAK